MTEHSGLLFRIAADTDIPVIRDLSSRIWREHYPGIISRGQIDYMLGKMYAPDVIRDEIANRGYRYVIVRTGDEAVGYMAYRFEEDGQTVLISKLYLLPALHGKGFGGQMLQYIKDAALRAHARRIALFVNKNNGKAIAAYQRFGMNKVDDVVTDIGGGYIMDDYRMEIAL